MLLNAFLLALRAIRRNVMRSILTILGIVIGVASVIAMTILGDGTTAYVTNDISKMGTNLLMLSPGQPRQGPRSERTSIPFEVGDVNAIERNISNIIAVAPIVSTSRYAVVGNQNHATTIYGSNNDYFISGNWEFDAGRDFSKSELNSGQSVCVIGSTVQKELFGNYVPLGEKIRLQTFSCKVVGVLKSKGAASFGMDQDDLIVVPIKMLQRRVLGSLDISRINISVKDGINTSDVSEEIVLLMRERRGIKREAEDDFHVRDMKDIIDMLSSTTQVLTILLSAVAAISLLVGGIGIMNIMLVSVTERTREIGIRLAIGALERDVLMQFLVESVVLSSIGGIMGILLGIGMSYAGVKAFDLPFVVSGNIIIIAFVFSSAVGIIFGYFPARKAAKLDPIDALRHE